MLLRIRVFILALTLFACGSAIRAEERLIAFHTDIEILKNGEAKVSEAITIESEGLLFKHGIYRDIALAPVFAQDGPSKLALELITRDGETEPFWRENRNGNTRIYIGWPGSLLPSGEHRYEIVYRTDNRIRDAGANDMFAWDVTGIWRIPIATASATLHLPAGVDILDKQYHAGTPDTSNDNVSVNDRDGVVTFSTIRGLRAGERLVFKILIPRNAIKLPSRS